MIKHYRMLKDVILEGISIYKTRRETNISKEAKETNNVLVQTKDRGVESKGCQR